MPSPVAPSPMPSRRPPTAGTSRPLRPAERMAPTHRGAAPAPGSASPPSIPERSLTLHWIIFLYLLPCRAAPCCRIPRHAQARPSRPARRRPRPATRGRPGCLDPPRAGAARGLPPGCAGRSRGSDLQDRDHATALSTVIRFATAAGCAQRAFLAYGKARAAGLIEPTLPRTRQPKRTSARTFEPEQRALRHTGEPEAPAAARAHTNPEPTIPRPCGDARTQEKVRPSRPKRTQGRSHICLPAAARANPSQLSWPAIPHPPACTPEPERALPDAPARPAVPARRTIPGRLATPHSEVYPPSR